MKKQHRICKECEDEFDWREKVKRVGGYSTVCEDCHLSGPDPDENTPVLRAVTTGNGKMAAISILSFDSESDANEYCRRYSANTGWNNRRTGGLNDIKHTLLAENLGNDNHKGKL
mgnify:FL=1|tara:strand:+ start:327 stop:671 length:345 start_codon:yes stop_codon:yes gene_type:complete